jgi:hypothetical protein
MEAKRAVGQSKRQGPNIGRYRVYFGCTCRYPLLEGALQPPLMLPASVPLGALLCSINRILMLRFAEVAAKVGQWRKLLCHSQPCYATYSSRWRYPCAPLATLR